MAVKVIKPPSPNELSSSRITPNTGRPGTNASGDPAAGRPATENTAMIKADRIVADAQAEADNIRARAEEEAQAAIQAATQQGEEEGHASANDLRELAERLEQQLQSSLEKDALDAAVESARELALAEVKHRPTAIVDIVRKALGSARHQREIFVRVSPKDAPLLKERKRELLDTLSRARDMDIREDPVLSPGSCVVETEIGIIDAQLQTQLDVLTRLLTGSGT